MEEFRRQESERALQQEKEKAKELRAQAIKNLKPANCKETRDFYYYEVPINIEIIDGGPRISESPRAGFYLASAEDLQEIGNNNLRTTFYMLPFEYFNYSETLKDRRNVYTLKVYSAIRSGLSTLQIITRCDKNGNDTSFDYLEAGISAVYIKYKPNESQIQEEIDRLKKKE
ncbi:MAG: hypothetical protein K2G67_02870 [Muribaculaceae bacterium]|nr:hypothetical protein [Muribaculaceae bacterium]